MQLAAKHFPRLSPTRIVIKGDNKAVIDFMTNTGKYRRPDLQQSLQEAHHLLAFRLPPCYWCYTPREFNKCADYLAGVARDHARECLASTTSTSGPLELSFCPLPPSLSPSFSPPPLLSTPPSSTHFTFPELPSFPPSLYPLLFRTYHTIPRILRYLRTLIRVGPHAHTSLGTQSPLAVSYKPSASDNNGRLYPYPTGAATLPRSLRFLLFGATHLEIDLVSAHYQFFQCAAHTFLDQPLPAAPDLRAALLEDMSRPPCTILTHFPQAPKRTPLLLLNSTLGDTLQYLAAFGYYPSFEVRYMLQRIHSTKGPLLDALERVYGPRTRNRCFFLLERLEASWMKHFVASLLSLFANRLATAALGISSLPLQLSCTSLNPKYKEVYKDIINGFPPPSHDSPPHFVPPLRLLRPPLSELEARTAFIRMMARQQQPRRDTLQLYPPPPPINTGEIIVID